jgi:hypothetical protein
VLPLGPSVVFSSWSLGLARFKKALYTPFVRRYGGDESDPGGGFPVENQVRIGTGLRKTSWIIPRSRGEISRTRLFLSIPRRLVAYFNRRVIGSEGAALDSNSAQGAQSAIECRRRRICLGQVEIGDEDRLAGLLTGRFRSQGPLHDLIAKRRDQHGWSGDGFRPNDLTGWGVDDAREHHAFDTCCFCDGRVDEGIAGGSAGDGAPAWLAKAGETQQRMRKRRMRLGPMVTVLFPCRLYAFELGAVAT